MKKLLILAMCVSLAGVLGAQIRSFHGIYSDLDQEGRVSAASEDGYTRSASNPGSLSLLPPGANPAVNTAFLGRSPTFVIEAVRLVPQPPPSLLAIYNSLRKIQGLKGRVYHSATRDKYIPLFSEAVRIEGPKKIGASLPDPPPAASLAQTETIYVRLKDANFGNCYYEIKIHPGPRGILCTLTNFKTINYGIISVMKENRFNALLYIEPVNEGILVYSAASSEVSNFVAGQINIPSALRKRLAVIIGWMVDGIK
jgi:hypothetical protein